jgi:hypothetical protein
MIDMYSGCIAASAMRITPWQALHSVSKKHAVALLSAGPISVSSAELAGKCTTTHTVAGRTNQSSLPRSEKALWKGTVPATLYARGLLHVWCARPRTKLYKPSGCSCAWLSDTCAVRSLRFLSFLNDANRDDDTGSLGEDLHNDRYASHDLGRSLNYFANVSGLFLL